MRFDLTYEELKLIYKIHSAVYLYRFDLTYEELKPVKPSSIL